jgi:hypothetical protein
VSAAFTPEQRSARHANNWAAWDCSSRARASSRRRWTRSGGAAFVLLIGELCRAPGAGANHPTA